MGLQPPSPAPWPTTLGIRQIATLGQCGRIVQDIRCEHWDIPLLLNKCIPIAGQPFAQGLPEKLRGLQQADTTLVQSTVDYTKTFGQPGCMIPQSVANALREGLKRTHIDPTETIVVPDDLYQRFGDKLVSWFQPPPLPPAVPQTLDIIEQRMNKTSGHSEVSQGTPPSPNSSGRLVEALQAAAAGQFGFQARWTADMVQRLANLMHYSHVWRYEVEDVLKIYSWLPEQIMHMVVQRARESRWDVQVDTNNGASGQTDRKLKRAMALNQLINPKTGEPALPTKMLRDAANIDHEEATRDWQDEVRGMIPMMAAPAGAGQPGQPEQGNPQDQMQPASDGQGSASSNGDGGHSHNGNGRY